MVGDSTPGGVVDWEEMAAWFDEKQGYEGDLWHRALIHPTVLQVLGRVVGLRALDLACGNGSMARWLVEKAPGEPALVWRKVGRYQDIRQGACSWRVAPGRVWHTAWYHRPLSWYFRALRAAEFAVAALEEPRPTAEFLESDDGGAWVAQVPLHCVFEAVRIQERQP